MQSPGAGGAVFSGPPRSWGSIAQKNRWGIRMIVKRYRGTDMQEALRKVKQDLGADAMILSTRQVRAGRAMFGLFGRPLLEVTAARPPPEQAAPQANAGSEGQRPAPPRRVAGSPPAGRDAAAMEQALSRSRLEAHHLLGSLQDEMHELQQALVHSQGAAQQKAETHGTLRRLQADMADLRRMMMQTVSSRASGGGLNLPENLLSLHQQLVLGGVEEKFSRQLVQEAARHIPPKELDDFTFVKIFLARMLMKLLKVTGGLPASQKKPQVFALVGPTGVGKTTTVAKIASEQLLRHNRKTALITVDTYRIGAVEQLQTYARIMEVPLAVVKDRAELGQAITRFADCDVVLVDTAGRSQRDEQQMNDLRNLLAGQQRVEVCLTLSATTRDAELTEITRCFQDLDPGSICFTKLDETVRYGCILNHAIRFKLPLAFLTQGQNVPQDLEAASRERVIDLLLQLSDG